MLQRMSTTLTYIKAGSTFGNFLKEIHQITYSFYWAKRITKKIYNNIMNSMNLSYKMDTLFMNSESSKWSDPHRLLLSISVKTNLKCRDKYVALLNLNIYYTWKHRNVIQKQYI